MNYRHSYHAGNFADVLKHAVLSLILEALCKKEAPFCVLDTHAGRGKYDLWEEAAVRTWEYKEGIEIFLQNPHFLLNSYVEVVRSFNNQTLRFYPGSPLIAQAFLRPQDRMVLAELHPEEHLKLKAEMGENRQISVQHMDGYQALKAFLPPKEKRGLILIDPPFEKRDEFTTLVKKLKEAEKRWLSGIYVIWYPLKDFQAAAFFRDFILAKPKHLIAEVNLPTATSGLKATGIAIINPPWQLYPNLEEILPKLLPGIEIIRLLHADGPLVKL